MQSTYKYRFDHSTIYWTLIYIIVFVLLGGLLYHLYEGGYLSAWFTSFIVALIALMSLSIPRRIVVSDEKVEVRCRKDPEDWLRRALAAYDIAALMDYGGLSLAEACERVVMEKLPALGGSGGLIAIDHEGNVALPFNTEGMYRAWGYAGDTPTTGIYREKGDTVATQ